MSDCCDALLSLSQTEPYHAVCTNCGRPCTNKLLHKKNKYEYLVCNSTSTNFFTKVPTGMQQWLDSMGEDDWELCGIDGVYYIFKRLVHNRVKQKDISSEFATKILEFVDGKISQLDFEGWYLSKIKEAKSTKGLEDAMDAARIFGTVEGNQAGLKGAQIKTFNSCTWEELIQKYI
jgi:hypothetical protein